MVKKKKSMVEGRTAEEAQTSKEDRGEFLRQREKRKFELMKGGATQKQAGAQATGEIETGRKAEAAELYGERRAHMAENVMTAEELRNVQAEEKVRKEEAVIRAEAAGAFKPLPEEPKEIIPGEEERSSLQKFSYGLANIGVFKKVAGIVGLEPKDQIEVMRAQAKQEIMEGYNSQIEETSEELDKQMVAMGLPSTILAGFAGGAISEIDIAGVFFSSKEKVSTLKSTIETLNQMSTTISTSVADGTINGDEGLKAMQNIQKILDLREQQIQKIAISSPTVRISEELNDVQTDLFEARTENQLELNKVATLLITGQGEPTEAQLLVKKQRFDNFQAEVKRRNSQ